MGRVLLSLPPASGVSEGRSASGSLFLSPLGVGLAAGVWGGGAAGRLSGLSCSSRHVPGAPLSGGLSGILPERRSPVSRACVQRGVAQGRCGSEAPRARGWGAAQLPPASGRLAAWCWPQGTAVTPPPPGEDGGRQSPATFRKPLPTSPKWPSRNRRSKSGHTGPTHGEPASASPSRAGSPDCTVPPPPGCPPAPAPRKSTEGVGRARG